MPLGLPAVMSEINGLAKGLLANFGANDAAVLDIIFVKSRPGSKLAFKLPSLMRAPRNLDSV